MKQSALITSTFIFSIVSMVIYGTESNERLNILNEYRNILPEKEFSQMLQIYSNESMSPLEKEKKVVNFFSMLPHRIKSRLPVPIPFRSLDDSTQQKIKKMYYERGVKFEEKLSQIKQLIEGIYAETNNRNVNDDPNSEYIEFNVNVTLKLTGLYRKDQMKNYLNEEEIKKLNEILLDNRLSHEEKSTSIGELLRRIFRHRQNKFSEWPILLGMENLPVKIRRAITDTLFSEDPTNNVQHLLDFYYRLNSYTNNETSKQLRARRHINRDEAISISKKDDEKLLSRSYADYDN